MSTQFIYALFCCTNYFIRFPTISSHSAVFLFSIEKILFRFRLIFVFDCAISLIKRSNSNIASCFVNHEHTKCNFQKWKAKQQQQWLPGCQSKFSEFPKRKINRKLFDILFRFEVAAVCCSSVLNVLIH